MSKSFANAYMCFNIKTNCIVTKIAAEKSQISGVATTILNWTEQDTQKKVSVDSNISICLG